MFRYRLVVVAAPTHRLAGARGIHFRDLARDDWFVDPAGQDPSAEVGALLDKLRVAPSRIRVFPSQTAALAAAPRATASPRPSATSSSGTSTAAASSPST